MPAGRPKTAKYTDEIGAKIADLLFEGKTIREACKELKISTSTFYKWLGESEEFEKLSTRVREIKAHQYMDYASYSLKELRDGVIDPQTARVLFDGNFRMACKLNQKTYGDKQQVEHSGGMSVKLINLEGEDK